MTIKHIVKNISAENEYIISDILLASATDRMFIRNGHLIYMSNEDNPFSINDEGHLIYTSDNENIFHINDEGHLISSVALNTEYDASVLNIKKKNLYNGLETEDFIPIANLSNNSSSGSSEESQESIANMFDELADMFNEDNGD